MSKTQAERRGAPRGRRTRPVEMPTRERILSLVRILSSFNESTPIIKKDLLVLLKYEYENYIFREIKKILEHAHLDEDLFIDCEDLLLQLIDSNEAKYRLFRDEIVYKGDSSYTNDDDKELVLMQEDISVNIEEFLEIAPSALFRRGNAAQLKKALSDIGKGKLINWISPSTLISDLDVLLDNNYGIAGKIKPDNTRWNSYGYYTKRGNRDLEIWELKILYESVISNQFLEYGVINDITETILNQTSADKHEKADSICHKLPLTYYTESPRFKDTLRALIDMHLNNHRAQFDYVYATVKRGEYVQNENSQKEVVPMDIVVRDGFYYLLGATENGVRNYRVDRIRNLVDLGRDYSGILKNHPEYAMEKNMFYRNNTNNFSGGNAVNVVVKWDFDIGKQYTALFDVFGFENISQGDADDQFIIKTRDNYGMYLNLLRLGPVIKVLGPTPVANEYASLINQMYDKSNSTY